MTTESSLGNLHFHYAWGGRMLLLVTLGMREKGRLVVFQGVADLGAFPWNRDEWLSPEEWL